MAARLRDWLLREGTLPEAVLQAAVGRQLVYGGTLDTALLETGAMTEAAVWGRLAAATGLPVPAAALCDGEPAGEDAGPALPAERTAAWRAVPVANDGATVTWLCAEPIAADEIRAAAAEQGLKARLYVVPEVRLLAARQRIYGETLPGRYAPLVARALGTGRLRPRRPRPSQEAASPARPSAPAAAMAPPFEFSLDLGLDDDAPGGDAPSWASAPPAVATETLTPLEHVLGSASAGSPAVVAPAALPPAQTEVEVEVEMDAGAQPTIPMADVSDGPVRLQLISEVALPDGRTETPTDDDAAADAASGDTPTEVLCRRARDPDDKGRVLALRALRMRLEHPAVADLLQELRTAVAADDEPAALVAARALGELRDGGAAGVLLGRLDGAKRPTDDLSAALHDALVAVTAQDFGVSRRRWRGWAARHGTLHRAEWLLEGLSHKSPEIRMAAAEDLRHLSGDSFGYLFDLPKREREQARLRWKAWWHEQGARRVRGASGGTGDGATTGMPAADDATAPAPGHGMSPPPPPQPPPPQPPGAAGAPDQSPSPPPFPLPPAPKAR